jgi:hypothetical protein
MSPVSSESKNKPSKYQIKKEVACIFLLASFSLGLIFEPEDGRDIFLRNVG